MATFTVTWDAAYEADPADTDLANLLGDDIRDLKRDIAEREKIDHSWAGDGDDGKHKVIQLIIQGDPGLDALNGGLYTKAANTVTQMFYKDSAGAVKQISPLFRSGTATPVASEDGDFVGQRFFDTVNIGWYTCTAAGSPGTWAADIEPKTLRLLNDTTVPAGWLLCDGTASTPDLRGRFIVGFSAADVDYDALGVNDDFGEKKHTLSIAEMPSHFHDILATFFPGDSSNFDHGAATPQAADQPSKNTGGGGDHENRPPYSAQMWIIKKPV